MLIQLHKPLNITLRKFDNDSKQPNVAFTRPGLSERHAVHPESTDQRWIKL